MTVDWLDNATFEMGGYAITLDYEHGGSKRASRETDFTMMKTKGFLDLYMEHKDEDFSRILELGIYQGGSFVFFDQLWHPKKISALDLTPTPVAPLDHYVEKEAQGRGKIYYGASQDDKGLLQRIIAEDFGGEIDFVVDDASHFYQFTKASFTEIFPRVRPGGLYIIEDWAWCFQGDFQVPDHPWKNFDGLPNMVIDLMEEMTLGTMIADIKIYPHMIKVRRSNSPSQPVFTKNQRRGRELGIL